MAQNVSEDEVSNFGVVIGLLGLALIILVVLSFFLKKETVVTKSNFTEFRAKYMGKTEDEIKKEFGTPYQYQPPQKGMIGGMTYWQSKTWFLYVMRGLRGGGFHEALHYKNKMDYEEPVIFVLNKKFVVVDIESKGLDIDGVEKPKLDITQ
jgi:hypothetical protein